jgi:hypothetical protein
MAVPATAARASGTAASAPQRGASRYDRNSASSRDPEVLATQHPSCANSAPASRRQREHAARGGEKIKAIARAEAVRRSRLGERACSGHVAQMRARIAKDKRGRWRRIHESSVSLSADGTTLCCADEMPAAVANEGGTAREPDDPELASRRS